MNGDLRYPVGPFRFPDTIEADDRESFIGQIAETPARLRSAVAGLDETQLATTYRPGGWSVRQVVHHLPDSHLNSYVRFKLAVTEDLPTIRTYDEAQWAELSDAKDSPIDLSLDLLESLHERWVYFLRSMASEQYLRRFRHPELGTITVDQNIALYAWHGRHHVAHITTLRKREGWDSRT